MKIVILALVLACFSCTIATVSAQTDEGPSVEEIRNLSLVVPTTGTAVLGTKESMYEYQSWLDECSSRLTLYSNQVLKLFGMKEMDWPDRSSRTVPVATSSASPVPAAAVPTADPLGESATLTTVTTITGGAGRQSVNVTVPYGYWEMWYTADPITTGGQDSHSATGSNSAVFPSLSVVVSNAAEGEEIETIEPPGGLDSYLWQRSGDPRPWSKKFYQGNKEYTFDITARHVKSYVIEVRVPKT